jgi:hypothetical protein
MMRRLLLALLVVLFWSLVITVTSKAQSIGFLNIVSLQTIQKCISAGDVLTTSIYLKIQNGGFVSEETVLEVQVPGMSTITTTIPAGTESLIFNVGHVAPMTPGYYPVTALTRRASDGLGDTAKGYFYVYDSCYHPKVVSITPLGQSPGQKIEISGEYFSYIPPGAGVADFQVWFIDPVTNGVNYLGYYDVISWEDTLIRCKIPLRLSPYKEYVIKICRASVCSFEWFTYTLGGYDYATFVPFLINTP